MSGSTLVSATRTDFRPIAWGGAPLHRRQAQIRAVVRRRLGERHFQLLSEPQPHDNDNTIDWYSNRKGADQALSALPPEQRDRARTDIATLLHDIDLLGQSMEGGATEDCRLAGKLLRFAVHGPTDEHLFMVDGQPGMACWGYDFQGIGMRGMRIHDCHRTPRPPSRADLERRCSAMRVVAAVRHRSSLRCTRVVAAVRYGSGPVPGVPGVNGQTVGQDAGCRQRRHARGVMSWCWSPRRTR